MAGILEATGMQSPNHPMRRTGQTVPVTIHLTVKQQETLDRLAKAAGVPFSQYAANIFSAAYAARVKPNGADQEMERAVRIMDENPKALGILTDAADLVKLTNERNRALANLSSAEQEVKNLQADLAKASNDLTREQAITKTLRTTNASLTTTMRAAQTRADKAEAELKERSNRALVENIKAKADDERAAHIRARVEELRRAGKLPSDIARETGFRLDYVRTICASMKMVKA